MNRNVIITCAVTGAADTVGKHPDIPVTPKQIAASAIEAAKAGAAVAETVAARVRLVVLEAVVEVESTTQVLMELQILVVVVVVVVTSAGTGITLSLVVMEVQEL